MTTTSTAEYYRCIKRSLIAHARIAKLGKSINPAWQFSMPHIMEWVEPPSSSSLLEVQTGLIYDPCVFGDVSVFLFLRFLFWVSSDVHFFSVCLCLFVCVGVLLFCFVVFCCCGCHQEVSYSNQQQKN